MTDLAVLWHDVECGDYREDLALWRELAGAGPVLDVGAGTGRVTLDLAAAGVPVVALDSDAALLAALDERAAGLPVETLCADARAFDLGAATFPAIFVPMQTLQLLGGADGRAAFLRCARTHRPPVRPPRRPPRTRRQRPPRPPPPKSPRSVTVGLVG